MAGLGYVLVVLLVVLLIALAMTEIYRSPWGLWIGGGGVLIVAVVCVLLATGRV